MPHASPSLARVTPRPTARRRTTPRGGRMPASSTAWTPVAPARVAPQHQARASASTPLSIRSLSLPLENPNGSRARPHPPPLTTISAAAFRRRRTASARLPARNALPPPPLLRTSHRAVLLATVRFNREFPARTTMAGSPSSCSACRPPHFSSLPMSRFPCLPFPRRPRAHSISSGHGQEWLLTADGRRAATTPWTSACRA
jgi:hypothetical protein